MSAGSGAAARVSAARDFLILTKPRVVLMVVLTAAAGYHLGSTGPIEWPRLWITLAGVALAAAGTAALNQYLERDVDARMERTRRRPLPDGRVRPRRALGFGLVLILAGLGLLGLVGGVPGGLPAVAGWAAARSDLGAGAWVLFGILYLWQVPHTLAIARLYMEDYLRGGIVLPPAVSSAMAEAQSLAGCVALAVVSLLATPLGLTGAIYAAGAVSLGAVFLAFAAAQAMRPSRAASRRTVLASLLYLPALLILMSLDKA